MKKLFLFFLILSSILISTNVLLQKPVMALPLYTNSRWIVDEEGNRVKLACVNWVSHLETMVVEGLRHQPLDVISKQIVSMGFNCVRLTWSLFMVTDDSLAPVTVRQSFQSLDILEGIAGVQLNNPSIIDLPLVKAFQVVVYNLAENNVMIILDNHISKPGWCCSNYDGNGFFGDEYFDPDLWLKGLTRIATMFNGTTNVVGMSLRNELRGPHQNEDDWYRYMQKGAEAVHSANSNVIVILSGLNYDKDFSFLAKKPVSLTFQDKLVFELHWYGFSDSKVWETKNMNEACGSVVNNLMSKGGFVMEQGWPLFLSEFGIDQRGTNDDDNRFLGCFLGVAVEWDLDWALWTLVGSYYLRDGVMGYDETYGLLNWDWNQCRNSSFLDLISPILSPFQGPGLSNVEPYNIIFHPLTGLCVLRKSSVGQLDLGSCTESEAWSYTPQRNLLLKGTDFCLQANGVGKPAELGITCTDSSSIWEAKSDSKMHLSSQITKHRTVCLDVGPDYSIITNSCKCLSKDHKCNPESQWFKIVNSTRSLTTVELALIKNSPIDLPENDYIQFGNIGAQFEGRSSHEADNHEISLL